MNLYEDALTADMQEASGKIIRLAIAYRKVDFVSAKCLKNWGG